MQHFKIRLSYQFISAVSIFLCPEGKYGNASKDIKRGEERARQGGGAGYGNDIKAPCPPSPVLLARLG